MHSSVLLIVAYYGFAAADSFPWIVTPNNGIPEFPDLSMEEIMNVGDFDFAGPALEETISASASTKATDPTSSASGAIQEPCAAISQMIAASPAGSRPIVPAELGVRCLQSVPLDRTGNVQLIQDLKVYVKWQSNIAYLKTPPPGYNEQPVDIMGELDTMQRQLGMGNFKTEYDFQMQLMDMFTRAYDNHFVWQSDILASAIQFQRPPGTELISLSTDGIAMPDIYTYRDVLKANNDSSFKPSPVRTINGVDVQTFLTNASAEGDFHDIDTRFNALFPSQALIASGTNFLGSFRTGMYPGPNTTFQFANGTTFSMPNLAVVVGNFTGVNSGQTFFQKFCSGPQSAQQTAPTPSGNRTAAGTPVIPTPSHIGYPKAVLLNPNLSVGGYYLTGTGYEVNADSTGYMTITDAR